MESKHEEESRKGNPIASMRFRWSLFVIDSDDSLESEWEATKDDAIRHAAKSLLREFEKHGVTNLVAKVFNQMNHKQAPVVVTLREARIMFEQKTTKD